MWMPLGVRARETERTKKLTETSPGSSRRMRRRRMLRSQVDSSSETFLTPAPRRSSKSCLLNMVNKKKNFQTHSSSHNQFTFVYHHFSISAGPLSEVLFPIDNLTKKPKGFAFITYMIPENAVTALAQLDGHIFQVFELQLVFDLFSPHHSNRTCNGLWI